MKILPSMYGTDDFTRICKLLARAGINLVVEEGQLSLDIDEPKLLRVITRNAGGSKAIKIKGEFQSIKVSDVRKLMKEYGSSIVAKELGISRATLYNRLKEADEKGFDELF